MSSLSLVGGLAALLAASLPVEGAKMMSPNRQRPQGPAYEPKPDGKFHVGGNSTVTRITNRVACKSSAEVSTWSSAASAYVKMVMEAIVVGCQGDVPRMVNTTETSAEAFARIAIDTFTSCDVQGSGWGCATARGSGMALARAVYDAWVEAYSEAKKDPNVCDCVLDVYAASFASVDHWGNLLASSMASVENGLCQDGTGTATITSAVDCYAHAIAKQTVTSVVGAWLNARDNCVGYTKCGKPTEPTYVKCVQSSSAEAKALARVVLDVDTTSSEGCTFSYSEQLAKRGSIVKHGEDAAGGANEISKEKDFKARVRCVTEAFAEAEATAVSLFVETAAHAMLKKCESGVDKPTPAIDEGVAHAFATAWVNVMSKCTVADAGTDAGKGCAVAEAFSESFAQACVNLWAVSTAAANIDKTCGCKVEGAASDSVQSFFTADLFSQAIAFAAADMWGGDGEKCVTAGTSEVKTTLDCTASAMATVFAKASARALIQGKCMLKDPAVCKTCCTGCKCDAPNYMDTCAASNKLYVSTYAEALVDTAIELREGYCTGENKGGFYYFDGTLTKWKCYKGCQSAGQPAAPPVGV